MAVTTRVLREMSAEMQPPIAARAHVEAANAIDALAADVAALKPLADTVAQLTRRIEGLESRVSALEGA